MYKNNISPLVSVCVITYNHAPFIRECLDGILMQKTDFPYEICIGEDESSDGTREICQEYAEKHPDLIRLFFRSRKDVIIINGKPTGRLNSVKTVEECRGKYLALCEGDDFWTDPLKLQKQVDVMESDPGCAACVHNGEVYEGTQPTGKLYWQRPRKDRQDLEEVLYEAHMLTASMLIRREWTFLPPVPDWFIYEIPAAGEVWVYEALKRGHLRCLNEVMSVYRKHPGGVHSPMSIERKLVGAIEGRQILLRYDYHNSKGLRLKLEQLAKHLISFYLKTGRVAEARPYLKLLRTSQVRFVYQLGTRLPSAFVALQFIWMKLRKKDQEK
jgi:glycosyltransferase involved in cell wall biosynthesis